MNLTPLVTDALDRLADIVPLTPLARLEIDGVLTALCEAVRRQALAEAAQVAERAQEQYGSYEAGFIGGVADVAAAIRALT